MPLANFERLMNGIKSFDAHNEFVDIVQDNKEVLTALQREQLSYGKDRSGHDRIDEYRPLTLMIKSLTGVGLGAVTDRVTFFMTGDLYQSLVTNLTGDIFRTVSPLFTFDKMVKRIGADDYGLDEQQRISFATETAMPKYRERFKQVTGLTMKKA